MRNLGFALWSYAYQWTCKSIDEPLWTKADLYYMFAHDCKMWENRVWITACPVTWKE